MADAVGDGIAAAQRPHQPRQPDVLDVLERPVVGTLELDADGEVVAAAAAAPLRLAGVPGALRASDELGEPAVAPDQEMARDLRPWISA
jgi:hypothetical protein